MSTAVETPPPTQKLYTVADLLAMPDDGVDRWLAKGNVRFRNGKECVEKQQLRNSITTRLMELFEGKFESYRNVFVEFGSNMNTAIDLDLAIGTPDLIQQQDRRKLMFCGTPLVAVYIARGADTYGQIWQRVGELLSVEVPLVWVVDPHFQTVAVYRPNQPPEMFNTTHTLDANPHMSGFTVPVIKLFRRG